jgi:hypothetical protein
MNNYMYYKGIEIERETMGGGPVTGGCWFCELWVYDD